MMKIKGIDLYKKVLEKDEKVLNRKFTDGNLIVTVEDGYFENTWGLTTCNGENLLSSRTAHNIHSILSREWEEIKESVDFMTAINAWNNNKVVYGIDKETNDKTILHHRTNMAVYLIDILNYEWYIED